MCMSLKKDMETHRKTNKCIFYVTLVTSLFSIKLNIHSHFQTSFCTFTLEIRHPLEAVFVD